MKIETLEVSGFIGCLESLRLPFKKEVRSIIHEPYKARFIPDKFGTPINGYGTISISDYQIELNTKDLTLLQTLIKKGDEHAKSVRLINVTAKIQAPLFWWSEENTYTAGVTRGCSESTMHTLKKESISNDNFEYSVHQDLLDNIQDYIDHEDIEKVKSLLPNGYLQTRVINYNYQTLRRMWLQRKEHKLPQWKVFIEWITTLPLAEKLILIE